MIEPGADVTDPDRQADQLAESIVAAAGAAVAVDPPEPDAPQRPALTLTDAADATGRDRRTLRRYLDDGRFPAAYREDDGAGQWRVPVTDLLAAGLQLHAPSGPDPEPAGTGGPAGALEPDELAHLRDRLADAERRAAVAEAVAVERERIIQAQQIALRALGAGPQPEPAEGTPPPQSAPSPAGTRVPAGQAAPPRRRWPWRR